MTGFKDWSWKPELGDAPKIGKRRKRRKHPKNKKALRAQNKKDFKAMSKMVERGEYIPSDLFFKSGAWRGLRRAVFRKHGKICGKCRSTKNLHIDHVKPRWLFPDLQLDFHNLQVLCRECNLAKSTAHGPDHDHRIDWNEYEMVLEAQNIL